MTKSIIYFLLIMLFFYSSCTLNKSNRFSTTNKSVEFNIGFPVSHYKVFRGNEGTEYIAFADFSSYRAISVYTLSGEKICEISLKNVMDSINQTFNAFEPISIDSFALLSKYTNRVIIINQKGKIIFKKDYSRLLLDGIELYPPLIWKNDCLLMGIDLRPTNDSLSAKQFLKKSKQFYNLFIDTNFLNPTGFKSITYKMNNFRNRYAKNGSLALETHDFMILPRKIITFSLFCDSIYLYNPNYQLDKTIEVNSKYFDINLHPVTLDVLHKKPAILTKNAQQHNEIWKICYDKYRNVFYCFIRGARVSHNHFPFSVIVYDSSFNKLSEQKFDYKKYLPNGYVNRNGLNLMVRTDEIWVKKFKLFQYE